MIAIHDKRLESVIDGHKALIDLHISDVQKKLTKWIKKPKVGSGDLKRNLTFRELYYLRLLRSRLDVIIKINMKEIQRYQRLFDKILKLTTEERKENGDYLKFKESLIRRMGYGLLRSGDKDKNIDAFYPYFYADLGIKSCVYCNSQLTVSVDSHDGKKSAKFQVDHYLPKAQYPCFSISFFNLYPTCASCNLKKGDDLLEFELFTESNDSTRDSVFNFQIEKKSLALFRITQNINDLKIIFDGKSAEEFNKAFDIQGIYNTQKDLGAEIISKSVIYNDSYKRALSSAIPNLYRNNVINFSRFVTGNYTDPKDIHKRPMAKFTQDISRQLGLIE